METVILTLWLVFNGVEIKHTEPYTDYIGNRSTMFFCTNSAHAYAEAFKHIPTVIITKLSCDLTVYDVNAETPDPPAGML